MRLSRERIGASGNMDVGGARRTVGPGLRPGLRRSSPAGIAVRCRQNFRQIKSELRSDKFRTAVKCGQILQGSREIRDHPLLRGVELPARLGTRGNAGAIVTKGGLVFLGGGAPYLYAFDKATGAELWRGATPSRTNAIPMTYRARSGRQFVVISTGAGSDAALVAFARSR